MSAGKGGGLGDKRTAEGEDAKCKPASTRGCLSKRGIFIEEAILGSCKSVYVRPDDPQLLREWIFSLT